MKKLFLITALVAFCATMAQAQFLNPSAKVQHGMSIPSTGYLVAKATATTNIASPSIFPIGNGLSVYALVGSTNANESNLYFRIQFSVDNVKWFGANNQQAEGGYSQFLLPIDAVGANAAQTNLLTEANSVAWRWARLHSVSNSGYVGGVLSNNVWITNFSFITH